MKIPKYIDRLLKRRTKFAEQRNSVSTELDEWLENNEIPTGNDYTRTMTDEQIIQALECCGKEYSCEKCILNTWLNKKRDCVGKILGNALDLINRQKDKIKEFDEKLIIQQGLIDYQKAEIERLKQNIDGLNIFTTNHIKVIRLQAMKEFAERLDEMIYATHGNVVDVDGIVLLNHIDDDINKLVKEMTEVQE